MGFSIRLLNTIMKNLYYVYRITCTHPDSNEKYYYGYRKSKTSNPHDDNYWGSSKYLKEAIDRYGYEYFNKKILFTFDDHYEALGMESKLHHRLDVDKNKLFFNRSKQTGLTYGCTGEVNRGKTYEEIYGEEVAHKLKKERSEAMKRHRKENPVTGENNPNFGNNWSEEQKKNLSKQRQGKNHPAYGWFWITNGVDSKKVPPNTEIPEGWCKGRKLLKQKHECPHCHKIMNIGNLHHWHLDNCKHKRT